MSTVAPLTRNITRVWRSCDEDTKLAGIAWYGQARELAAQLDPENVERSAAVIAVLSPMMSWPQNMVTARIAYALRQSSIMDMTQRIPCLNVNARKAARILHGADPWSVVSGRKVTAFWRLIADPWERGAVCIDRHAFDIAVGRVTNDAARSLLGRKGAYDEFAEQYRRAALILSDEEGRELRPSDVQAGTWMWWRVNRAVAYHGEVMA